MKHIVHVSNDFEPLSSGINTHLKNLLYCLSGERFKITLLVPIASDEPEYRPYIDSSENSAFKIVRSSYPRVSSNPLKLVYLTKSTQKGLQWIQHKLGKIDLIHQHDKRATRLGATKFAESHNIPIIWTNHSSGYFGWGEFISRLLPEVTGSKPDGIIAVHRSMADLFQNSSYSDIPIEYIPNGVDTEFFSPKRHQEIKGKAVVLYPQRMVPMKGPIYLAKAAVRIFEEYEDSAVSFQFAGSELSSNRDKKTINKVDQILKNYKDGTRVKFLGNISYEEMPGYYQKADIVVLPLQVETENISVFEAWATGTPLITTKQVEKNGYMQHEENCLIVPDRDPQKLAEAIVQLSDNFELREKLAENGRKIVIEQFTWSRAAEETLRFYGEFFNKGKG